MRSISSVWLERAPNISRRQINSVLLSAQGHRFEPGIELHTAFFAPRNNALEVLTCRVNTCYMFLFLYVSPYALATEGASRTICARSTIIIIQRSLILILILILIGLARGALRSRTTSLLGEDSYCRGSIVNIRVGCTRALFVRGSCPKALWRFRVSTSNSISGRSWPHSHTQIRHIYHTYAQQDIRVYEDDHLKPPKRQYKNPKAL